MTTIMMMRMMVMMMMTLTMFGVRGGFKAWASLHVLDSLVGVKV